MVRLSTVTRFLTFLSLQRLGEAYTTAGLGRRQTLPSTRTALILYHGNKYRDRTSTVLPAQQQYADRRFAALQSTAEGDSAEIDDSEKERLSKGYSLGQYLFGSMGLLLMLMPDRTMTTLLASKLGGAAGFGIAAGLCYILKGANENDRLRSDTYKRLNIGLLGFNSIGVLAIPGEAGFLPTAIPAIILTGLTTLLRLYGVAISYMGWKRGLGTNMEATPKMMLQDLTDGTKSTFANLKVQNKKQALTYRNCLLLVGIGIVSSFMEGLFYIRNRNRFNFSLFEVSLQTSAIARLFMISTMIYSLKDAAERDRLTGTTFIQLNIMVGVWAFLVGIGQSIYPLGFAAYRGVEAYAFSLVFLLKALKSQKEKHDKKKSLTNQG